MSFYVPGNKVVNSTVLGTTASPSTSAVLAELTSTSNFNSTIANRQYVVQMWLGGSTGAVWGVEVATSPNVDSTSIVDQSIYYTASGQTSQFVRRFTLNGEQRIRVRHLSSVTGAFYAGLQAEEIV